MGAAIGHDLGLATMPAVQGEVLAQDADGNGTAGREVHGAADGMPELTQEDTAGGTRAGLGKIDFPAPSRRASGSLQAGIALSYSHGRNDRHGTVFPLRLAELDLSQAQTTRACVLRLGTKRARMAGDDVYDAGPVVLGAIRNFGAICTVTGYFENPGWRQTYRMVPKEQFVCSEDELGESSCPNVI
jgi:hypothetical protein